MNGSMIVMCDENSMDSDSESSTLEMHPAPPAPGLPENDGPELWEPPEDHPVDDEGLPYMTASFRLFMARSELLSIITSWEDYREATASLNRQLEATNRRLLMRQETTASLRRQLEETNHRLLMWQMTRGMQLKKSMFRVWRVLCCSSHPLRDERQHIA